MTRIWLAIAIIKNDAVVGHMPQPKLLGIASQITFFFKIITSSRKVKLGPRRVVSL